MAVMVGLLRGINVGGRRKILMADLRSALNSDEIGNVRTYIQSGNLVFDSAKKPNELEQIVTDMIKSEFGFDVPAFIRPKSFFDNVYSGNPLKVPDPKAMYVSFLSGKPDKTQIVELMKTESGEDEFAVVRDYIYVSCPRGFSKTKLTNDFFERKLNLSATSRNWRTIGKLVQLAGQQ